MSARKPAPTNVAARPVPKPAKAAANPVPATAPGPDASTGDASSGDASSLALALAGDIDRALNEGRADILSEAAVQALMAAACRSYSAQIESGGSYPPLSDRSRVTSTDVMVTASGLLKATNLAVFELGMWQSWTGR
jgi:hypothetical protein